MDLVMGAVRMIVEIAIFVVTWSDLEERAL